MSGDNIGAMFLVDKYNAKEGYHQCRRLDTRGRPHGLGEKIDLMVCGSLPTDITPEALVGKTVKVEYTFAHSYIALAEGVKIIDDMEKP